MSVFLQGLAEALRTLPHSVQSSVVQLFTDPAQLSSGDIVVLGASAFCVTVVVLWARSGGDGIRKVKIRSDFTPGKVYYHAYPPDKYIPCPIPFGLKLETYMRMADIPYEPSSDMVLGPKGKIPWIEYNGEALSDSNLIIEFLNNEKGVDLDQSLSDADRAVSRAFIKMLEENTYWGAVWYRFVDDLNRLPDLYGHMAPWFVPRFVKLLYLKNTIAKKYVKIMWAHGIGRHSKDEVEGIIKKDIKAVSDFLGTKAYLMGDDPTEADAAVFGRFALTLFTAQGSYMQRVMTQDCPNLQAYVIRMKERYWPDWDQLTGNTKKSE